MKQIKLFSGSAGSIGYRVLGTPFFNVSKSVGNDPNSIPTNEKVDASCAFGGDITAINNSSLYSANKYRYKTHNSRYKRWWCLWNNW